MCDLLPRRQHLVTVIYGVQMVAMLLVRGRRRKPSAYPQSPFSYMSPRHRSASDLQSLSSDAELEPVEDPAAARQKQRYRLLQTIIRTVHPSVNYMRRC
jgi:hypothetical protein